MTAITELAELSANKCFGGTQKQFSHRSKVLNCEMKFSVFIPPRLTPDQKMPVLYWLSGLTCTDENFATKAGAQRVAAKLGIMLVMPDTSPRGETIPDAADGAYDLGLGAGFYVNATEQPWQENYQMYDYIVDELPSLIKKEFKVKAKAAIAGHSMGGHGALIIALSNMKQYCSVSAFAPIVNPSECQWGQKAFKHYLGSNTQDWEAYDSCALMRQQGSFLHIPILIDQGLDDNFFHTQKLTSPLEQVAKDINYKAQFRYHAGYDHSYFFIASFIEEHLSFHAEHLNKNN
ncbi:S-formylglutathione hydrolase [Paraglaciecola sp. 2405UD69-4]|uniref:S-formylglutathione hydrolase n=1 Tax=Paraglaciecola sp. 2405UD69-4 TaxID=3391836 RepID=UPI0039C8F8F7